MNQRESSGEKVLIARLDELRQEVDRLDEELLDKLSERLRAVGTIAEVKEKLGRRIRDFDREHEILETRVKRAEATGFPSSVAESIFRLLLLASREYQSSLRRSARKSATGRPRDVKTIAILGGEGAMGKCIAQLFEDLGHMVLSADLDTELRLEDAAAQADVVVVSVPIRETIGVIRRVAPLLRDDALLLDVTSLKAEPLKVMLESTSCSVVGTHPMFGPGVHTLEGQRIVLCQGRGDVWLTWIKSIFEEAGLIVVETTAEEHDRAMAVVQVLNHLQTQVLGLALSRVGLDLEESLRFTSPAYLVEAYVTARHFAQSPELYGAIEMLNPERKRVLSIFLDAAKHLVSVLENEDQTSFDAVFEEVRAFFGEFSKEAEEQSTFLIDRLVELSTGSSLNPQKSF